MDPELIKAQMVLLANIIRVVAAFPLRELLAEYEHQDSFGLFTDPTSWIRTADNRRENAELLRALKPFHTKAVAIVEQAREMAL